MATMTTQTQSSPCAGAPADPLLLHAIAGALRCAHAGALPPFARTLGLPQAALLDVVRRCLPQLATDTISERKYAALMQGAPALFGDVLALLMAQRTPAADAGQVEWLARAIAAACMGNRFLWQDLGLSSRDDVGTLMRLYFQPLHDRNTEDLKWKRFIFLQLSAQKNQPGLQAPGCPQCVQHDSCHQPGVKVEGLAALPTVPTDEVRSESGD